MSYFQSNILRQTLLELHSPHIFNEHYGYIEHEGYRYWKALDRQTGQFIYKKRQLPKGKPEPSTEQEFQSILSLVPQNKVLSKSSKSKSGKQQCLQKQLNQADDVSKASSAVAYPTSALPGMEKHVKDVYFSLRYGGTLIKRPFSKVFLRKDCSNSSVPVDPSKFDEAIADYYKAQADLASSYTPLATGDGVLPYLFARSSYDKNRTLDKLYPKRPPIAPDPLYAERQKYLYGYQDDAYSNYPKHLPKDVIDALLESPEAKDAGIVPASFKSEVSAYTEEADNFRVNFDGSVSDEENEVRRKRGRELSRQIEALTPKAGFDGGPLFRGISADLYEVEKYLNIGSVHDQKGISSWTTEMRKSLDFTSECSRRPYRIVFVEASTPKKRALSVNEISLYGSGLGNEEYECIYPDSVKFKVKDFKVVDIGCVHRIKPTIILEVEEVPQRAIQ